MIAITSSGDLLKLNAKNGRIYWALSAIASNFAHDDDFFSSSEIVIDQNSIIFSVVIDDGNRSGRSFGG